MTETSFAKWLRERGTTHAAYAARYGMNYNRVALLAGVSRVPQTITRWHMPSLQLISTETGIPIATLIEDGTRAAANPAPPRAYTKRGVDDGKTAAAE